MSLVLAHTSSPWPVPCGSPPLVTAILTAHPQAQALHWARSRGLNRQSLPGAPSFLEIFAQIPRIMNVPFLVLGISVFHSVFLIFALEFVRLLGKSLSLLGLTFDIYQTEP